MAIEGNNRIFKQDFSSNKNNRKKIVDTIADTINASGITTVLSGEELYLVIDEAVTNAMEHGNKWDPTKIITVTISIKSSTMVIGITDQGNGFQNKEINLSLKKNEILGARGRGIYILYQLCKPSWNKKGNEIFLEIKIKP